MLRAGITTPGLKPVEPLPKFREAKLANARVISVLVFTSFTAGCGSADNATNTDSGGSTPLTAITAEMVTEELIKPRLREPSSAGFTNISFKQETDTSGLIICG